MTDTPDTARLDDALDRANWLRQHAISCRHAMPISITPEFAALLARQASLADAHADAIMSSMKGDNGDG